MNTAQRIEKAQSLRSELRALMTPEERDTYSALDEHLSDFIADLQIDMEREAD